MDIQTLYEKASSLGEPLSLNFWIHRKDYGPKDRLCGEVIIFKPDEDNVDVTVCDAPWGILHEHERCAYCSRIASHNGEGELVCVDHIFEPAAAEYEPLYR